MVQQTPVQAPQCRRLLWSLFLITGTCAAGPAPDLYEPDNGPSEAKETGVSAHTFHQASDVDWIVVSGRGDCPFSGNFEVLIAEPTGVVPSMALNVRIYDEEILIDPAASPIDEFNSCDGMPSVGEFRVNWDELIGEDCQVNYRFFSVRDCFNSLGVAYEATEPLISLPGMLNLSRISGTIVEEPSQQPVGLLYLLTDSNDRTVSKPGTGEFSFVVTPGIDVTMTVVSDSYVAEPVVLGQVTRPGTTLNAGSIPVVLKSIFRDGFEAP